MKRWLQNRFLPMWAKETVLRDNRFLQRENAQLQQKIRQLEAYIDGLHRGLRAVNRSCTVIRKGEQ